MFNQTLKDLANAVVEANRTGETDALLETRYATDCVSVEAAPMGEAAGLDAIRGKHAWWNENMEFHGGDVEGPYLFEPDRFAVRYTMDVTDRNTGERMQSAEVAIYTVKDNRIAREEFFYES
ncbi:MAG: nuclear transport factor 2 family protein [Oceanicaulis sp.]